MNRECSPVLLGYLYLKILPGTVIREFRVLDFFDARKINPLLRENVLKSPIYYFENSPRIVFERIGLSVVTLEFLDAVRRVCVVE